MATVLAVLALSLVAAPSVHAQPAGSGEPPGASGPGDRERALSLFEESVEHYRHGRFREAVDKLRRARELYSAPVLLYNLARAYEGLGELEQALDAYEQYLQEEPDTEDRGAIERRIETLREQIAEQERLAREREERKRRQTQGTPPEPPSEEGPSAWPFAIGGAGAAVLVAGTTLGVLAQKRRDDAAADPVHRDARQSFRQAERFALAANVSFAVGGLFVATGAAWLIVELAGGSDSDEVDVALLPGPASLTARIRWGPRAGRAR